MKMARRKKKCACKSGSFHYEAYMPCRGGEDNRPSTFELKQWDECNAPGKNMSLLLLKWLFVEETGLGATMRLHEKERTEKCQCVTAHPMSMLGMRVEPAHSKLPFCSSGALKLCCLQG